MENENVAVVKLEDAPAESVEIFREYGLIVSEEDRMVYDANIRGQDVSRFDLDSIHVPLAGSEFWQMPDGTPVKSFRAVILGFRDFRKWYKDRYQPGQDARPPDCVSEDLITGVGDPGGQCAVCPHNQWGTAIGPDGDLTRGKACGQYRTLFLSLPGHLLPVRLIAPPTSLKSIRRYFLAGLKAPYYAAITEFGLVRADPVCVIAPTFVQAIPNEPRGVWTELGMYAAQIMDMFNRTT